MIRLVIRKALIAATLACLASLCGLALQQVESQRRAPNSSDPEQRAASLYLPQKEAVLFASMGYRNALAHLIWFKAISYFGAEYRGAKNYRWLSHMCELVSDLSPRSEHVYRFCGTMLAWEGQQPEMSIKILDKAITEFPESWYFLYLRGFTYLYFLHDDEHGNADIVASAQKPGAHPIVVRLAAKGISASHGPESAIAFLRGAIKMTDDPSARKALESKLTESYYELGFELIERAAAQFKASSGTLPGSLKELETAGLLPKELVNQNYGDPYGGHYALNPSTGEVTSTSRKPRSRVSWNRKAAPPKNPGSSSMSPSTTSAESAGLQ